MTFARPSLAFGALLAIIGALFVVAGSPAAAAPPQFAWSAAQNPDPPRGEVRSVSCVRSTWCMAVDGNGYAVRYRDGVWDPPVKLEDARAREGLWQVACGTSTHCVALDGDGHFLLYNGSGWTAPAYVSSNGARLGQIDCPSATVCIGLGETFAFLNGATWTLRKPPFTGVPGSSISFSCGSPTYCTATYLSSATHHNVAWTYHDGTWSLTSLGTALGGVPALVSCPTRPYCMAANGDSNAAQFDGHQWTTFEFPTLPFFPSALSCVSSTSCLMIGDDYIDGGTESAEWDGHVWAHPRRFATPPRNFLTALSCVGPGLACVAVDTLGRAAAYRPSSWSSPVVPDPASGDFRAVGCSAVACAALDAPGGAIVTTGSTWAQRRVINSSASITDRALTAIACPTVTFCLATAVDGAARRFDGTSWHWVKPAPIEIDSLSCVSPTWCVGIGGYGGYATVFTGSTWTVPGGRFFSDLGRNEPLVVSCAAKDVCFATSAEGTLRRFDGHRWLTPRSFGSPFSSGAVSCAGPTFCMAAYTNVSWRWNGSDWQQVAFDGQALGVSCTSATFCASVAGFGDVQLWDGITWSTSTFGQTPDEETYEFIACASPSLCIIASRARVRIGTA